GPVQHGLVDVEPAALVAEVDEMTDVRPRPAGQVEVPDTAVAKDLLQPMNTTALRLVVDIGAHQVVITGQVGIEGIDGHGDLTLFTRRAVGGRASYSPRSPASRPTKSEVATGEPTAAIPPLPPLIGVGLRLRL